MNPRSVRPPLLCLLALGGGLIFSDGCASLPPLPGQKLPLESEAGLYKKAEICYQVDAGRLSLPVSIARVEGQRVSYDEMVSRPEVGCSLGSLTILYPHPDGREDVALARVMIASDPRRPVVFWNPSSWRLVPSKSPPQTCNEEWQLEMPKAELSQLIDQLRQDGCFTQQQPHAKAAQLTIGFDGRRVKKPWSQSPALEAMMQRVRLEGQLIALHRPAAPANKVAMTSSLISYRALVAQGGGGDGPQVTARAVSGLLMPRMSPATIGGTPAGVPGDPLTPAAPALTEIARAPGGTR